MANMGKAVFVFMCSSLLWNIECIGQSSHPCGDIYVESPALKDGTLIVKVNTTLKVTFGFTNSNCNFIEQICIYIWRWNQRATGFGEYLPQCTIRTTPTTCRESISSSLTCGCLKRNLMYFFQTNVTSPDFTMWKLSANTNSTACIFKMAERILSIFHESCSSVDMKGLLREPDGPADGNTFSMTSPHEMTAAVQTTLTGEKSENLLMGIIIYVLGAVIIIVIVMAIIISVIVRKLHMKETLHSDVTKFESRLEMSNLRRSLKEDEFAESANSSAYSQPKSTEITEHDYAEIH